MTRPLMQYGIGQLEEMFSKAKADPKVLTQLKSELQYRQVPRAVALLAKVQATMHGAKDVEAPVTAPSPQAPPSRQPDLWTRPPTQPTSPVSLVAPATERAPASTPTAASLTAIAPLPQRTESKMTVDDACKVLKTTLGATWESIEQTRRLLVQHSSPLRTSTMSVEEQAQALAEARRVNDAYAVVSTQRVGGH